MSPVCVVPADTTVYGKLGSEVDLRPEGLSVTSETKSIRWYGGKHIALDWDETSLDVYPQFRGSPACLTFST